MKLLLVEDDAATADHVVRGFAALGHRVDHAATGHDGLLLGLEGRYDVLLIDRMLPKLDGLALLKALRGGGVRTPVLFLTAMGGLGDKVAGFEAGGDDYLVKPFAFAELQARVTALARRPPPGAEALVVLEAGDLRMDLLKRQVTRGGREIALQPTEFRLLEVLLRHAGAVVTRTMLLAEVWDFHFDPQTNIVETHVSRLRSKVDRGFGHELIRTVRGAGYRIDAPAEGSFVNVLSI